MTGLDPKYLIAPSLEEYFVDKDTGAPLAAGIVTFYSDINRNVLKNVYTLSGAPPNYSYIQLPNPNTLTSVGTFTDGFGNNVLPYYYPYDASGNVENYYITVVSAGNIQQFTREGFPNVPGSSSGTTANYQNLVPNGQFWIHNNIPASDTTVTGQITQGITQLAQGGWTFERPAMSTAKDFVTFGRFNSPLDNPSAYPRYYVDVNTQMPNAGDTFKNLALRFDDVNKFASTTQQYTFAFSGISNTGSPATVQLVLIKNFGTGGSTTTQTTLATFTVGTSYGVSQASFVFGINDGLTVGALNDDYLQLAIAFPVDAIFDISLTDFVLVQGQTTITLFPNTPNAQFKWQSLAGFVNTPAYDGSDFYLPMVLTPSGMLFDNGEIGDVISESGTSTYVDSLSTTTNRMLADGNKYETVGYSPLGIPFARLQKKYFDTTINIPYYGTGADYFTGVYYSSSTNELIVTNNTGGLVTDAADGTPATTFTISTIHAGEDPATGYFVNAYNNTTAATFQVENITAGAVGAAPTVGTSGFSIAIATNGTSILKASFFVTTIVATTLAGKYFTFQSFSLHNWYVWFKVDGSGADPAPGGTGILVNLNSTDSAIVVAEKIRESLNGWQVTSIKTVAGSVVPAGSYFSINSTGNNYYVWYTVNGVGTDPKPSGKVAIPVSILSTDTNAQVAVKTQVAINMKFFQSPDFRGWFLRGSGSANDSAERISIVPLVSGDLLGTFEFSANISHNHTASINNQGGGVITETASPNLLAFGSSVNVVTETLSATIDYDGGIESRPPDKNVRYVIKY